MLFKNIFYEAGIKLISADDSSQNPEKEVKLNNKGWLPFPKSNNFGVLAPLTNLYCILKGQWISQVTSPSKEASRMMGSLRHDPTKVKHFKTLLVCWFKNEFNFQLKNQWDLKCTILALILCLFTHSKAILHLYFADTNLQLLIRDCPVLEGYCTFQNTTF